MSMITCYIYTVLFSLIKSAYLEALFHKHFV